MALFWWAENSTIRIYVGFVVGSEYCFPVPFLKDSVSSKGFNMSYIVNQYSNFSASFSLPSAHCPPPTVCHLLSTYTNCPLSTTHCPPLIVYHTLSTTHSSLPTDYSPQSTIHCPPPTVHPPLSTTHSLPQSTILCPPPTVHYPQSQSSLPPSAHLPVPTAGCPVPMSTSHCLPGI